MHESEDSDISKFNCISEFNSWSGISF